MRQIYLGYLFSLILTDIDKIWYATDKRRPKKKERKEKKKAQHFSESQVIKIHILPILDLGMEKIHVFNLDYH